MIPIPGGTLRMGSSAFYPDEGPVHDREIDEFDIDEHPVTNRQFAEFVDATGYRSVAEEELDAAQFPQLSEAERAPGSMVFTATAGPVDLRDWRRWWAWIPGAFWSRPSGPGSSVGDRLDHPVVHVALRDASAYAHWAGKRLPTEPEWEWAARGGLIGATFAWGDEERPGGQLMANSWQGRFPYRNSGALGWAGTSPVGTFPPNGYGVGDMAGNVWEWTTTPYTSRHVLPEHRVPERGSRPELLRPPADGGQLVLKGGSHLCSPDYCLRYRPAARSPQTPDTSMTHIGFRCARDR